jgi:hypothetical protein
MSTGRRDAQRDAELRNLWSRRPQLNQREWVRLYELVTGALRGYRPPELAALPEDHIVYVQEYFEDKVFRLDLDSVADHEGAVRQFYCNYLIDKIRRRGKGQQTVDDFGARDDGDETLEGVETPLDDSSREDLPEALRKAGLTVERVVSAADAWFQRAPEWIPLYLGFHFCPDQELSEPLYKLAKRKKISSYHCKAEKLGIGSLARLLQSPSLFANTLIGQWLIEDLQLVLSLENRSAIEASLKILCFQALDWAENQENLS